MLLDDAVEKFLLSREADDRTARTIGSYRQRLSGFQQFAEAQGLIEIAEIKPDIVDAWVVSLRQRQYKYQSHPCKPRECGKLSKSTIAGLIQSVKALFEWCVERNYLTSSPAQHLKRPRLKKSARTKVMDPVDLLLIVAEAEKRAKAGWPRDLALVLFTADTGCRRSEIKSLRIPNLNLDDLEALVRGKTTGEEDEREVEFGEESAQALQDWLTVRPKVDHDYVFVSLSTNPDL